MKVLQVELTDGQHKKLRMAAAERAVAMTELVRWWIDGNLAVVGAIPAKVTPPESKGIGAYELAKEHQERVVSKSHEDWGNIPTKTCVKCKDKVTDWVYTKDNKPLCKDCAEDLSKAIP